MINDIAKLGLILVEGAVARSSRGSVARMSQAAVFAVVSVAAALAIVGCSLAALWVYIRPYVGEGAAWLCVAAAIVVLWLAAFFIMQMMSSKRQASRSFGDEKARDPIQSIAGLFSQNGSAVLVAAFMDGLAAGRASHAK